MIKLPEKIRIGAGEYKVIGGKDTENEYVGYHDYCNQIIKIAEYAKGEKRNDLAILETILHECIHGISSNWLPSDLSEDIVTALSTTLFGLFAHNNLMLTNKKFPDKVVYNGFIYKVIYPIPKSVDMDEFEYFSTTNDNVCKIFITKDHGNSVVAIKTLFLKTAMKLAMKLSNAFTDKEIEEIYNTCFYQGLYQVLVDNKLDTLIYKTYKRML